MFTKNKRVIELKTRDYKFMIKVICTLYEKKTIQKYFLQTSKNKKQLSWWTREWFDFVLYFWYVGMHVVSKTIYLSHTSLFLPAIDISVSRFPLFPCKWNRISYVIQWPLLDDFISVSFFTTTRKPNKITPKPSNLLLQCTTTTLQI